MSNEKLPKWYAYSVPFRLETEKDEKIIAELLSWAVNTALKHILETPSEELTEKRRRKKMQKNKAALVHAVNLAQERKVKLTLK